CDAALLDRHPAALAHAVEGGRAPQHLALRVADVSPENPLVIAFRQEGGNILRVVPRGALGLTASPAPCRSAHGRARAAGLRANGGRGQRRPHRRGFPEVLTASWPRCVASCGALAYPRQRAPPVWWWS